jgi:hypothetical protein
MVDRRMDEVAQRKRDRMKVFSRINIFFVKYLLYMRSFGLNYMAITAGAVTLIVFIIGAVLHGMHDPHMKDHMMALELGALVSLVIWAHIFFLKWLSELNRIVKQEIAKFDKSIREELEKMSKE